MQPLLDQAQGASHYHSDGLQTYQTLLYKTDAHQAHPDKRQTYSVEAGNADLGHYLGRLHRRSRCFSRCPLALWRAVWLFA
jgi:IS1 family transposase